MPPAGFEPAIPAGERAQAHALDCATTGNAFDSCLIVDMPVNIEFNFFFLIPSPPSHGFSFVSEIFSSGRSMSFYICVVILHEEKYVCRGRYPNGVHKQFQKFEVAIALLLPQTLFYFMSDIITRSLCSV